MIEHSRAIYGSLDLLGDVGGLLEIMNLIAGTMLTLFKYKDFQNLLASKLFFIGDKSENAGKVLPNKDD